MLINTVKICKSEENPRLSIDRHQLKMGHPPMGKRWTDDNGI